MHPVDLDICHRAVHASLLDDDDDGNDDDHDDCGHLLIPL